MKLLPIVGVLAFVALSCAVPLNHADEESGVVTQQDLADIIETIDALEGTATESQLYSWRRARDALKRAARRGVRVDVRANYAAQVADADLTSENIEQAIGALDKVTEQDDTTTESQLYSWRRARDALKRAARRGVRVDVRANYGAQVANADLTSENIEQAIEALDKVTEQDVTATESQLYSWRRARDALKRAARRGVRVDVRANYAAQNADADLTPENIEQIQSQLYSLRRVKDAFKRAARRGVRVDVRANYATQDANTDLTSENIEQVIEALDKITEQDASFATITEDQLYSLRRVKDAFKRAARKGVRVDVRANYALENSTEEDASSTNYFGRKLRKGLRKVGRVIENGAKKILGRGVNVNVPF